MSLHIRFFYEGVTFRLKEKPRLREWISVVIQHEKKKEGKINFIFCSDDYLAGLNATYLNRHSLTDVIAFTNEEPAGSVSGDIFISIDRIAENAQSYQQTFTEELHRVMVHGILHLIGYEDKPEAAKLKMKKLEDGYLSLI